MADKPCDIVLEGGGVKGIGLVGALEELDKAGYRRCRVAGTSAGAIVGSLVASGMDIRQIIGMMRELDYTRFRDETWMSKFGVGGKTLSILTTRGIYEGKYLREWLYQKLAAQGIRTFADLKLNEPWAASLPPEQQYRLVVIVSDVSRGRLIRLPWDYEAYGLDPDKQLVADAVRASMSIPYFYQPAKLNGKLLVDGGLLSNFPIDIFDSTSEWPTFGVKLSAKASALTKMNPVDNPVDYGLAILATATNAHDQMHLDSPAAEARTIFVDTLDVKATDFDINTETQTTLYKNGRRYAREFLGGWDYAAYRKKFPGVKPA